MKRCLYFVLLLTTIYIFVGCNHNSQNEPILPPEPELSDSIVCTPHQIVFDFAGGDKYVQIKTERNWSAECHSSWITLDNYSGNGSGKIKILCESGSLDTTIIYFKNDIKYDSVSVIRGIEDLILSSNSLVLHKDDKCILSAQLKSGSSCSPTWNSSNTSVALVTEEGEVFAVGYGDAVVTATFGAFSAKCSVKVIEKGYFKVGNKYLKFSPGNFSASSTGAYGAPILCVFESPEYQYGFLSQWGSGGNPLCNCEHGAYYHNVYNDWGINTITYNGISYEPNTWRAATSTEWSSILSSHKYASATIIEVHGVVLLPTDWSDIQGIVFNEGLNGWSNNVYSAQQWEKMSKEGAVFLPAAGYFYGTGWGYHYHDVGLGAYYWASGQGAGQGSYGCAIVFYDTEYNISYNRYYRENKFSVRLVREL